MYKIETQFSHVNKLFFYIFFFSLPAGLNNNLAFFPTLVLIWLGGHANIFISTVSINEINYKQKYLM